MDGDFDLFHAGHVELLERAREMGTYLYVGVHSDEVVAANRHGGDDDDGGRNYPPTIMSLHERAMNVLSCRCVDDVVIGAPWVVDDNLLRVLNVHVVAVGAVVGKRNDDLPSDDDGGDDGGEERKRDPYELPKERGIFRVVEGRTQLSTGEVVQRIIDNRLLYEERNRERGKKELDYLKTRQYVAEL